MTPGIMAAAEREETAWTPEEVDRAWLALLPQYERQRRAEQAARGDGSEAALERQCLLHIGKMQRRHPTLMAWRNEVGLGFQARVMGALAAALAPFGPEVVAVALGVLKRHRVAFGVPGSPDIWVVIDGRAAGIELKTQVGRASDAQIKYHGAARMRGCFASMARAVDEMEAAIWRAQKGELR